MLYYCIEVFNEQTNDDDETAHSLITLKKTCRQSTNLSVYATHERQPITHHYLNTQHS